MSPGDVLKLIKEKEATYCDLRFSDTRGKEQHVTVPAHTVDETLFTDGKMFDGSSIAGWKGINESDMILMPDPSTAMIDPFYEETTLLLRCDVVEPTTMQGYGRDPRSLAKRAEAYLKSTGIADSCLFGPENEFFIFDSVRWTNELHGCSYHIDSVQGAWNSGTSYDGGNLGHRPGVKGGYFGAHIIYRSELGQTFWTAIAAWVTCFVVTILVSLATRPRPDEELRGLVYSLTPKPSEGNVLWYERPTVLAVIVLSIALLLNIIFF